ncbi:hypothetical protein [uncultured Corynebacterium sp.]|uniref:hypothetical protein n=1 Tax=uncultured Corynebacterium sp. TaxID=159447 RepID=UPI002601CEC8|nr:hypothetical protein [uncultured Corynebacterium sp.]
MSNIADLEERINSAEAVLEALSAELESLKQQEQPEPEPESLFGRWATHPEYGRGIIISSEPDGDGEVRFACRSGSYPDGATRFDRPESFDLDPATLSTAEDFEDAPEGTIAEATTEPRDVYVNDGGRWWVAGDNVEANPTTMPPCRVIRWGNGQ